MATSSSSDASTILTVGEQSSDVVTSFSASVVDSAASISSASYYSQSSGSRYHSNASTRQSEKSQSEMTRTSSTSDVTSDLADRRGGARRKEGGGNSVSDSEMSSYYSADWSSERSDESDSEQSASYRAHSVRQKFIKDKLRVLKKSRHHGQRQTSPSEEKAALAGPQKTTEERLFCRNAIRVLGNKTRDTRSRLERCEKPSRNLPSSDACVFADRETFNRLKIENLLSSIKKAASVNVDGGLDSCTHCSELKEASIKRDFIHQKTCKLKNELTEKKVDWLLNTRDPLTAIGELVQSLPKPSDDPSDIWDRLMNQRIT